MKPLLICLLLISSLAFAEPHDELIDRAFATIEDDPRERWTFTRTDSDGESTRVGIFDPRLAEAEQWSLVSIDGRAPEVEEIEGYRNERRNEQEEDDKGSDEYGSIMKDGSATLIIETDDFWLFAFEPVGDSPDDVEFMSLVDGTLKIMKDGEYVAEITLQNRETIKPGKGVKIQNFFTLMEFVPFQTGGPVLLTSVQARVRGKAMLVVKFDETETIDWSGYERVLD